MEHLLGAMLWAMHFGRFREDEGKDHVLVLGELGLGEIGPHRKRTTT